MSQEKNQTLAELQTLLGAAKPLTEADDLVSLAKHFNDLYARAKVVQKQVETHLHAMQDLRYEYDGLIGTMHSLVQFADHLKTTQ